MNKKVLITLIVFLVVIGGFYLFRKPSINEVVSPVTSSTSDCVGICASFDSKQYYVGEGLGNSKDYTDPVSKNVIKFRLPKNTSIQTRNPSFEVYVNDKLAGTAGGQSISQTSFSPDHKYFAFRMQSTVGCAGACQSQTLYVIDLNKPAVMYLLVQPGSETKNTQVFQDFETFIESYSWGVDSTILLTTYPVGMGKSGKYYRTSQKEVWSFDLSNPESVMRNGLLVNTVPEK